MASNSKMYKEHFKRMLYSDQDKPKFFHELTKTVSLGVYEKVRILVDILKREGQLRQLADYRENDGESVLHIATKFNQSSNIILCLIKACPVLMLAARKEAEDYCGQTPLHIAIAKGNVDAVETMLSETLNHSQSVRISLLHTLATGRKFDNTVMMGELPLTVAALTFKTTMIDMLLQNGAEMERMNSKGDTVFHSLIRFAAIYPEHKNNVLATLEYLNITIQEQMNDADYQDILSMEYDHRDNTYIWFIPNKEDLNPLQLAASLSQSAIFQYILGLPRVYCFLNNHDGLFDRKLYDITEIDTTATEKWAMDQKFRRNKRHIAPSNADGVSKRAYTNTSITCFPPNFCLRCEREQRKSILEIMFDIKCTSAFEFIQLSTLRQVIKTKWLYYRNLYYGWMVFHFFFMIILTVFSIQKADHEDAGVKNKEIEQNTSMKKAENTTRAHFIQGWSYVYLVIALLYLLQEIWHLIFRNKSFHVIHLTNVLHNTPYRFILFLFSTSLIVEFALDNHIEAYENFSVIVSLITGWWFLVFFLRAQKKFSFFTVMIQKVIFGDMLRFSIIIALVLVSFTAAMYMTFKGSMTEDLERHSFGGMMLMLFRLMLGLGEIDELYKARQPWLAVTLFVIFVLLTYVMMFNALIAMMSQTCTLVSENRHVQWRVQQLSVILFFEGILPSCLQKSVGTEKHVKRFDPIMKQVVEEKRYFLDISSLQTEYANAEDIYNLKHKLQTLPFGEQRTYAPNFLLSMNTQQGYPMTTSPQPVRSVPEQKYEGYHGTEITVTPAPRASDERADDAQATPNLKRRKSKKEKKIPDRAEHSNYENVTPSSAGRGIRRKQRVEPEGDYQDDIPHVNGSRGNRQPINRFLPVPSPFPPQMRQDGYTGRHRHYSESDLMDINVSPQGAGMNHDRRVQLPVEQINYVAPAPQNGSLDIGVIEDSYM